MSNPAVKSTRSRVQGGWSKSNNTVPKKSETKTAELDSHSENIHKQPAWVGKDCDLGGNSALRFIQPDESVSSYCASSQ